MVKESVLPIGRSRNFTSPVSLDEYFPSLFPPKIDPLEVQLEPSKERVINIWYSSLRRITNQLLLKRSLNDGVAEAALKSIDDHLKQGDHGAEHSYDVYRGMKWLAEKEGGYDGIDDSKMQAAAVLHDLGQMIPFKDPLTGDDLAKENPQEQRIKHAEIMNWVIWKMGTALQINRKDIGELRKAILHHDDTPTKEKYASMNPLGGLLADSDKLFGAGDSKEPNDLARDAIVRNQTGSANPEGWYLLRDDLNSQARDKWQYGDRWYGDRVGAVRKEIFKTEFYTKTGEEIAQQRKTAFVEQAKIAYGKEYDAVKNSIREWQSAYITELKPIVTYVGKGIANADLMVIKEDIPAIIKKAYEKELPIKRRDGYVARGSKIQVKIGEVTHIIDPSIARFTTKEDFLTALIKAFIE